jgi:allantoate deiminase
VERTEHADSRRIVEELNELTGGPEGAQRVAWTDEWARTRYWVCEKLDEIDYEAKTDEAGNLWITALGDSEEAVLLGGHMDSVPNGGWLDSALDTIAALEVLRTLAPRRRPVTLWLALKTINWGANRA